MNSEKYKLIFKNRKIICIYNLYLIFKVYKNQKLYIVDLLFSTAIINKVYSDITFKSVKIKVDKSIKSKNSELYNKLIYCRLEYINYFNIFRLSNNLKGLVIYKTKFTIKWNICKDYLANKLKEFFIKKTDFRQL